MPPVGVSRQQALSRFTIDPPLSYTGSETSVTADSDVSTLLSGQLAGRNPALLLHEKTYHQHFENFMVSDEQQIETQMTFVFFYAEKT
jgi:hypothetical protein